MRDLLPYFPIFVCRIHKEEGKCFISGIFQFCLPRFRSSGLWRDFKEQEEINVFISDPTFPFQSTRPRPHLRLILRQLSGLTVMFSILEELFYVTRAVYGVVNQLVIVKYIRMYNFVGM